ncbi:hypothetical protein, partial [Bacteroides heparinolyticus]|uniref:hypothetical protein n=1 Tax=Prevotella heparinolytica TaxID=28113 RepID=UPI0035A1912E
MREGLFFRNKKVAEDVQNIFRHFFIPEKQSFPQKQPTSIFLFRKPLPWSFSPASWFHLHYRT